MGGYALSGMTALFILTSIIMGPGSTDGRIWLVSGLVLGVVGGVTSALSARIAKLESQSRRESSGD